MSADYFVAIDETEVLYSSSSHTPLMTADLVGWMMNAVSWVEKNCKDKRTREGLLKAVVALADSAQVGSRLANGAQYASISISQLEKTLDITRKTAIRYLSYLTLTGEYESLRQTGVEPLLRRLERGKSKNQASSYEYIWPRPSKPRPVIKQTSEEKPGFSPLVHGGSTSRETFQPSGETRPTSGENQAISTPTMNANKTTSEETDDSQYRAFLSMFEKAPGNKAQETRREYELLRNDGWSHGEIIDAVKRQMEDSSLKGREPCLYPHTFLTSRLLSRWLLHAKEAAPKRAGVYRDGLGNWCHVCAAGYEEPIGPPSMPEKVAMQIHNELKSKEN